MQHMCGSGLSHTHNSTEAPHDRGHGTWATARATTHTTLYYTAFAPHTHVQVAVGVGVQFQRILAQHWFHGCTHGVAITTSADGAFYGKVRVCSPLPLLECTQVLSVAEDCRIECRHAPSGIPGHDEALTVHHEPLRRRILSKKIQAQNHGHPGSWRAWMRRISGPRWR